MNMKNGAFKDVYSNNLKKGNIAEHSVQSAFRQFGYSVKDHDAQQSGVDLLAMQCNSITVGEILNWSCKGYIHNKRFMTIVNSLFSIVADRRCLFCFGVSPTASQRKLLHALNVKLYHFKDSIKKITKSAIAMIVHVLRTSTVITVCACRVREGVVSIAFCCNYVSARFFDWFRQKFKLRLCRFGHSFHGFVRSRY